MLLFSFFLTLQLLASIPLLLSLYHFTIKNRDKLHEIIEIVTEFIKNMKKNIMNMSISYSEIKRKSENKASKLKVKCKKDLNFYCTLFTPKSRIERQPFILIFFALIPIMLYFIDSFMLLSPSFVKYITILCWIMVTRSLYYILIYQPKDAGLNLLFHLLKLFTLYVFSGLLLGILSVVNHYTVVFFLSVHLVFFTFLLSVNFLKSFPNLFLVRIFYFISILIFTYLCVGFIFGSYYWIHNQFFEYFDKESYSIGKQNFSLGWFLKIAYIGLEPMFSYQEPKDIKNPLSLVPFGEYFLGHIINIIFIGIGVSFFNSSSQKETNQSNEE